MTTTLVPASLTASPPSAAHVTEAGAARLLILLYHRSQHGPHGNSPEMLEAHFAHIAAHYPCVLPGEPLRAGRLNVCLSFDDGYYDFHRVVWPLLEKYDLRALLAVAPGLILEKTSQHPFARMRMPDQGPDPHTISGGLCTWPELRELATSRRVAFAVHGMTHTRLDDPTADFSREILDPGLLLTVKLLVQIENFVFPFGRFTPLALKVARAHYRHIFRIGQAINSSWDAGLLYRVSADNLATPDAPFTPEKLRRYRARAWWNRLRGR